MAVSGLFFAADLGLWHWSIKLTSVANSTLLVNLAPVFVAPGACLLFGERFSATFLVGLMVALTGAALLVGGSPQIGPDHLLAVAAAVMAYAVAVSRAPRSPSSRGESGRLDRVRPGDAPRRRPHLPGGRAEPDHPRPGPPAVGLLLGEPTPAAAGLAWVMLGEALGAWQGLGGAIVLVGIVLARRGTGKPA